MSPKGRCCTRWHETPAEIAPGCCIVESFDQLPADEPFPGVLRRRLDAAAATMTSYAFQPGARFPVHRHDEEQITLVDEGSVVLRLRDRAQELGRGAWVVIAGGVDHGITAGADGARITAIVVPRRGDGTAFEIVEDQGVDA
jgi:quercetin dioxygenase-like cupin family protein